MPIPTTGRPAIQQDPLPQAGSSLRDRFMDRVLGPMFFWAFSTFFVAILAATDWARYLFKIPPTLGPCIFESLIALTLGILAFINIRRALREQKSISAGIRGEQHVAHYLHDFCAPLGYRVFHDIPCKSDTGGTDFNIDHALIGPASIFCIETKNWTKPPQGTHATIDIVETPEGLILKKNDGTFDAGAIKQAFANADKLRQILSEETGIPAKDIRVHPVLLMPGWYIRGKRKDIWIFGDNTLHAFLKNEPRQLSKQDENIFASKLSTHIRNALQPSST